MSAAAGAAAAAGGSCSASTAGAGSGMGKGDSSTSHTAIERVGQVLLLSEHGVGSHVIPRFCARQCSKLLFWRRDSARLLRPPTRVRGRVASHD
eukprot:SAG11_NODE_3199_length_2615_cov_1484.661765_5_plen_94_part_00